MGNSTFRICGACDDSSPSGVVEFTPPIAEGLVIGVSDTSAIAASSLIPSSQSKLIEGIQVGSAKGENVIDKAAWRQARKATRENRKKTVSTLDTQGFLSSLPETRADIAFRFSIILFGVGGSQIARTACAPAVMANKGLPSTRSKRAEERYRCFSNVPFPLGSEGDTRKTGKRLDPAKFNSNVPKLCKLLFCPFTDNGDVLGCRTRMEALSCALVCSLVVDPAEGEPSFHEQMTVYERLIDQIHFAKKALRPARAMLLIRQNVEGTDESWKARLEEHEACLDEDVWKFGPMSSIDGSALHAAFATIASKRVMRKDLSDGEDSEGSQQSDPPPIYMTEGDGVPTDPDVYAEPIWLTRLGTDPAEKDMEVLADIDEEGEDEECVSPGPTFKQSLSEQSGVSKYSGKPLSWLSPMQKGAA